jgi:predicted acyltransferase
MIDAPAPTGERIDYLDAARGCAIFLMIFVNFVEQYTFIPPWTKHASGNGFTYVDGIAPAFLFIMGVSSWLSFSRRATARGLGSTVLHAARRFGLLFLFGSIGSALLYLLNGDVEWSIFQTLALAGAVSFPFLLLRSPWMRIGAALLLMAVYQLALSLYLGTAVFAREPRLLLLPSALQSIALATIVVFGSGAAPWMRPKRGVAPSVIIAVAFLGLGFGLSSIIAPNRPAASAPYLCWGLAMAAGIVLLFAIITRWPRLSRATGLPSLGKNALVLFMIASILITVLNELIPPSASASIVLPVAAGLEGICLAAAALLERRRLMIRL